MLIIGTLIAPLLDGIFDAAGYAVLTFKPLENFYSMLLDIPYFLIGGYIACIYFTVLQPFVAIYTFQQFNRMRLSYMRIDYIYSSFYSYAIRNKGMEKIYCAEIQ